LAARKDGQVPAQRAWRWRTPFGGPVDPEVYITTAGVSGVVSARSTPEVPAASRSANVSSAVASSRAGRDDDVLQGRAVSGDGLDGVRDVDVDDRHRRVAVPQAVLQGVRAEQHRERYRDGPQFPAGEVDEGFSACWERTTATRSPCSTPRAASPSATRSERSSRSAKENVRVPSAVTSTSAGRDVSPCFRSKSWAAL